MSEQLPTIYQLIPKVMADVGVVGKSGFNSFDKYKFRSIDDVYNSLQPVLAKHGVFIVPRVLESHESTIQAQSGKDQIRIKVKVEYKICAPDGSFVESIFEGEGIDRSDKATNKAVQASFKYMVSQLFCLAFEGMDDADKESPESGQKKPVGFPHKPKPDSAPAGTSKQQHLENSHQTPAGAPNVEQGPIVNHAMALDPEQRFFTQDNVDEYRLTFKFGSFKEGMSFSELGPKDTKQLLVTVQSWRLKFDNEGKPIPPQLKQFIELAKMYLSRFE